MRVLFSVWDKGRALPLARRFQELGAELWASAGTAKAFATEGLPTHALDTLTGFEALLGGRVKTLHPTIFAGILAISPADLPADHPVWDVVVVDLYPFSAKEPDYIELIDVGGVSLIRAAAKNFQRVWVIPGPAWYEKALHDLAVHGGMPPLPRRQVYAAAAFQLTAHYDAMISQAIFQEVPVTASPNLRYGENPHQTAVFVGRLPEVLLGKALSYNNLLDIEGGLRIVSGWPKPACVILKHTQPCGAAYDADLIEAYRKALAAEPTAAYGGIVVCNFPVEKSWVEATRGHFIEILAAPAFSDEAVAWVANHKKQTTLVRLPLNNPRAKWEVRSALGGTLWQTPDTAESEGEEVLRWAERILRQMYSNAVVVVREGELLSGAGGQTSRIEAVRLALQRAQARQVPLDRAWLVSDGFFPFPDSIELSAAAGIRHIAAPTGGKNQDLVAQTAKKLDICLTFLPYRHFRH
jgi:phosphoribosylaminoimidazolecarboxamide formyltransferase/IMP cyclohydrolase